MTEIIKIIDGSYEPKNNIDTFDTPFGILNVRKSLGDNLIVTSRYSGHSSVLLVSDEQSAVIMDNGTMEVIDRNLLHRIVRFFKQK